MQKAQAAIENIAFERRPLVIDTNVVLDLLVFDDPAVRALGAALRHRTRRWLVTGGMRSELQRVLGYPRIAPRLSAASLQPVDVLAAYDGLTDVVSDVTPAPLPRCRDADDQPFIDLAAAHRALLLSKDGAVLALARALRAHDVMVISKWLPALD